MGEREGSGSGGEPWQRKKTEIYLFQQNVMQIPFKVICSFEAVQTPLIQTKSNVGGLPMHAISEGAGGEGEGGGGGVGVGVGLYGKGYHEKRK